MDKQAKIETGKFIGPIPRSAYEAVGAEFHLYPFSDVAMEITHERLGREMAKAALKDLQAKLESRSIDWISGLMSKEDWLEKAAAKLQGFESGRRRGDRHNSAALLMIDAHKFKKINDRLGYEEGNRRLGIIAQYLMQHSRPEDGDLLTRVGGDEFYWLAPFDATQVTANEVILSIDSRLRDIAPEEYPDLPSLRWNHTFYQPGDDIEPMMKRVDVKGPMEEAARSHKQSKRKFEEAQKKAGIVLA